MSTSIAIITMLLIYLGLITPVGKPSIVYTAIVCQSAYFSAFQLDQIPLTLSGFTALSYSNGFNQINAEETLNQKFPKFGLGNSSMFHNYNLSYVVLCLVPLTIGLVGIMLLKIFESKDAGERKVFD